MVNFICDACGQTIKKQKVEKHYQIECRKCSVLSCIDCGQDFPGDAYAFHTSCISEAEKYQGKLYKAKEKANKGERKQQEWLEQVRSASSDGSSKDPRVRKLMAKITTYSNVPRKEKKFKKFCENSVNIRDQGLLEKLWQTFSEARRANASNGADNNSSVNTTVDEYIETAPNSENATIAEAKNKNIKNLEEREYKADGWQCERNGEKKKKDLKNEGKRKQDLGVEVEENEKCENVSKKRKKRKHGMDEMNDDGQADSSGRKKKKRKSEVKCELSAVKEEDFGTKKKLKNLENIEPNTLSANSEQEQGDMASEVKEKFKWETVIKKLLKAAPDNEMTIKKLRKKVISEYIAHSDESRLRSEEEIRGLFKKKLHKNPKVKIHKERAKYCK